MKTGAKKIIYVAGMIVLYIIALKAGHTGNVENIKDVAGHILQNQENVLKDDSVKKWPLPLMMVREAVQSGFWMNCKKEMSGLLFL